MKNDLLIICFLTAFASVCFYCVGYSVGKSELNYFRSEISCLQSELSDCQSSKTIGIASYYSTGFHGKLTASGEVFDSLAFTCAHPSLPFGTRLNVYCFRTDRTIQVRVNDRGPYHKGRIIDLSYRAAKYLRILKQGVDVVEVRKVK